MRMPLFIMLKHVRFLDACMFFLYFESSVAKHAVCCFVENSILNTWSYEWHEG